MAPRASCSERWSHWFWAEAPERWPWPSRSLPDHRLELSEVLAGWQWLRKASGQRVLGLTWTGIPHAAQWAGVGADPRGDTRVSRNSHSQPCHLADLAKQIIFFQRWPQGREGEALPASRGASGGSGHGGERGARGTCRGS